MTAELTKADLVAVATAIQQMADVFANLADTEAAPPLLPEAIASNGEEVTAAKPPKQAEPIPIREYRGQFFSAAYHPSKADKNAPPWCVRYMEGKKMPITMSWSTYFSDEQTAKRIAKALDRLMWRILEAREELLQWQPSGD